MYEAWEQNRPPLPRSLQVGDPTRKPSTLRAVMNNTGLFDHAIDSSVSSAMSGIEVVDDKMKGHSVCETELLTRRHEGMQRTKDIIYEQIANSQFPLEESDFMVRCLEKTVDVSVRQTYFGGKRMRDISETAIIPKIGMNFMAGADSPQVNRMEQVSMTRKTPDQKSAIWRVNTAGTLLSDFEVDTDLSIIQTDNTSQVIASALERVVRVDTLFFASNIAKRDLVSKRADKGTVTIHSDHVELVSDLTAGGWDLESTLIEVDGSSLTNLIVNYRHLIHRGGPALTFPETVKLLDVMIEDARRLYIRSPILFRMSTRRHIISSKKTRYGVDHGLIFRTLTTSRGIKNIVSLSASYFNALSTSGSKDKSQQSIRPKFLQMLVLLLSLLNDEDLGDLKEFLEATYRIKADRLSLELLILKVLPLMSINSKVFINSLLMTVEVVDSEAELDSQRQCEKWNKWVQRLLHLGYMLPGTVPQLGQTALSWVIKWPQNGIKDSYIFRNLQYRGASWTMNDIPSLDLHLDPTLNELTVLLTNGGRYIIGHDDVEKIICMSPGRYSVADASTKDQADELDINEVVVNSTLSEAIFRLNRIVAEHNNHLSGPQRYHSMLTRLASLREKPQATLVKEVKGSGRLTRNVAKLSDHILAVAYKVEGRKITRRDLLRHLTSDLRTVTAVARILETAMQDYDHRNATTNVRSVIKQGRQSLVKIRDQIAQADESMTSLANRNYAELGDEPISKVFNSSCSQVSRSPIWYDYHSWYVASDNILYVEAQRHVVDRVRWITDSIVEVGFPGSTAKYLLSPLAAIAESERADEIRSNDSIILVGQYLVVVELGEGRTPNDYEAITNWLKIVGVEQYPTSRRGMNRNSHASAVLPRWMFR